MTDVQGSHTDDTLFQYFQLNMYKERYEEFQSTINKSNDMFQKFKTEMDKVSTSLFAMFFKFYKFNYLQRDLV